MSDNFHSAECALRHNGVECTCDYIKPLTKQEKCINELQKAIINARIVARAYLYEIGMDGASAAEQPVDEIADMAIDLLTHNLIGDIKKLGKATKK